MARKPYTNEEDNYIRKTYGILPTKEIAENLGRTIGSVSGRASKIGIKVDDRVEKFENGTKKRCPCCKKILPIDDFKYLSKGKMSEGSKCNECRRDIKYQKWIDKKLEGLKKKNGFLTDEELQEREIKKNEQTFICSMCGKEMLGVNFTFKNKKTNEVDCRCIKCRSKRNVDNKLKSIVNGGCW